jgi:hypothetical protein
MDNNRLTRLALWLLAVLVVGGLFIGLLYLTS